MTEKKELARYISVKEISESLGITKSGIFNLIKAGKFPTGIKVGNSRRWRFEDVDNFLSHKECDLSCAN